MIAALGTLVASQAASFFGKKKKVLAPSTRGATPVASPTPEASHAAASTPSNPNPRITVPYGPGAVVASAVLSGKTPLKADVSTYTPKRKRRKGFLGVAATTSFSHNVFGH